MPWWKTPQLSPNVGVRVGHAPECVGSGDAAGGALSCWRAREGPAGMTEVETSRKLGILVWRLCSYGKRWDGREWVLRLRGQIIYYRKGSVYLPKVKGHWELL